MEANASAATMAPCNKWWVYTSNVDGHFHRYPSFRRGQEGDNDNNDGCKNNNEENDNNNNNDNNVCEIHGTAGIFRCSVGIGYVDDDDDLDVDDYADIGGNNSNGNNENDNDNGPEQRQCQRQRKRVPRMGDIWNRWNERVEEFQTDRCHSETETLQEVQQRLTRTTRMRAQTQRPGTVDGNDNNDDDEASSMLLCQHCKVLPLRPNVLLFNDTDPNVLGGRSSYHRQHQKQMHLHICHQRDRYQDWEAAVEEAVVHHQQRLVLVEIGCGKNVPAVRQESQDVLGDVLELLSLRRQHCKTTRSRSGGDGDDDENDDNGDSDSSSSVTLIRINPKDAGIDGDDDDNHDDNDTNISDGNINGETTKSCVVSIFDTSLRALERIDRELDALVD